jgi:hypothetical protein
MRGRWPWQRSRDCALTGIRSRFFHLLPNLPQQMKVSAADLASGVGDSSAAEPLEAGLEIAAVVLVIVELVLA